MKFSLKKEKRKYKHMLMDPIKCRFGMFCLSHFLKQYKIYKREGIHTSLERVLSLSNGSSLNFSNENEKF